MAIVLGYDESGSGDTLLVTVQVVVAEQARKFKRKWNLELRRAGVAYFHAKEFRNLRYGVFVGLTVEQRLGLLRELSKLIRQHVSIGITAKVTKSLYEQKTTPEVRSRFATAYTFAVQMLVVSAYLYAKHLQLRPEFNILIEDGHRSAAQAIQGLQDTRKAGLDLAVPVRLLNIELGSKAGNPILQAAEGVGPATWKRSPGTVIARRRYAPGRRVTIYPP